MKLEIGPGITLWREYYSPIAQKNLTETVFALAEKAPFIRPVMPRTEKPFSVEQTNFGPLGWVSDKAGYRYQALHPVTARPWPDIPPVLLDLWSHTAGGAPPQCCLVNLYRETARMGLHQDRDETADAPVVSVSLGDSARFRIGQATRGGPTKSLTLASGDVLLFGGPARRAYHGIDRVLPGTSRLIPNGGRLNLTLRRVTEE